MAEDTKPTPRTNTTALDAAVKAYSEAKNAKGKDKELAAAKTELLSQLFDKNGNGVTKDEIREMLAEMQAVDAKDPKGKRAFTREEHAQIVKDLGDTISIRPNVIMHGMNILREANPKLDIKKATIGDMQRALEQQKVTVDTRRIDILDAYSALEEAKKGADKDKIKEATAKVITLVLDENKDGVVTRKELGERIKEMSMILKADKNDDGKITKEENAQLRGNLTLGPQMLRDAVKTLAENNIDINSKFDEITKSLEKMGVKIADKAAPATAPMGKAPSSKGPIRD